MNDCSECNSHDICIRCSINNVLINENIPNICQSSCPISGYYTDGSKTDGTGICKKCNSSIPNCIECSDENVCTKCTGSYKIRTDITPFSCVPSC